MTGCWGKCLGFWGAGFREGLGFTNWGLRGLELFLSMGAKPFLLNRVWVATDGCQRCWVGLGRGGRGVGGA